jgi:ubiquinone biosynthesis protein
MTRGLRNIGRLLSIARTLARHDALTVIDGPGARSRLLAQRLLAVGTKRPKGLADMRPGERLATALRTLGPSFIKLGQALSVRADLVGDEIADDLSSLQDQLPPFPADQARRTIEEEFGKPLDTLFSAFDDEPVAAASIAQVHFAITSDGGGEGDGKEVAVKILRPGIEQAFARDLDLLRWLAETAERRAPHLQRLRPVDVIETLARSVAEEMDLRLEAAAGDELRENFGEDPTFRIPAMDWTRTGRRVLTVERISGTPIDEPERLSGQGHDPETLVANMARAFFLQVFRDGFFHADLHPGNLLVAEDGAIQAIDFGITGRLDRQTRHYLAEMLAGFLSGDYRRVADVHIRAGYVPAHQSREAFAQAARSIAEPILGLPLRDISLARLLAQLFRITERFEMETQPQLLLLQKTMLVAEGVGRKLCPDTNMWELARPLIEDWMQDEMTVEARAAEAMDEAGRLIERLPHIVSAMGEAAERLTRDGIRLDPATLEALAGNRHRQARWPLWAGAAVIVGLVIAVL